MDWDAFYRDFPEAMFYPHMGEQHRWKYNSLSVASARNAAVFRIMVGEFLDWIEPVFERRR